MTDTNEITNTGGDGCGAKVGVSAAISVANCVLRLYLSSQFSLSLVSSI